MNKRDYIKFIFFLVLFYNYDLYSQVIESDTLPLIEVTIDRVSLKNSPYNTSTVIPKESYYSNTSVNELLQNVAGLFTLSPYNFAQDTRISSRGFGARSGFGIRGIKILSDDLPDSTPDGQAQLDNIDFNAVSKIEMLKGPQAGIYGVNSGGVLSLKTFDFNEANSLNIGMQYGGFNLLGFNGRAIYGKSKFKAGGSFNHLKWDGYREWSQYKNTVANAYFSYRPSLKHHLDFIFNFIHSPFANDPGSLNLNELALGRDKARDRNLQFKASENLTQQKLGLKYQYIRDNSKLNAKAYYIARDFENFLPFSDNGSVNLLRSINGLSLDYNFKIGGENITFDNLAGVEVQNQKDLRKQFKNNNGEKGVLSFEQDEIFKNNGIYLLSNVKFYDRFRYNLSLRYDNILTKAKDYFLSNGDQSGERTLNNFNYSTALSYEIQNSIFSIIHSTGTESPTLNELSNNPEGIGGFNFALDAMKSVNYEINIKSSVNSFAHFQTSLFKIATTNEIIPFELPSTPGRLYYRNAGKTSRVGFEMESTFNLLQNLTLRASYTLSNFKYEEYQTFNNKFLPGIPQNLLFADLRFKFKESLRFILEYKYVDKVYVNDLNEASAPSYNEFNLKGSFDIPIGTLNTQINLGVNNLFNAQYFSNLRINAAGGRFYEAAMPRFIYTGINFKI